MTYQDGSIGQWKGDDEPTEIKVIRGPDVLSIQVPWDSDADKWLDVFRTILTWLTFSPVTIEELLPLDPPGCCCEEEEDEDPEEVERRWRELAEKGAEKGNGTKNKKSKK